ncbi:polysaccharide biosynthesis tyrosine autokinase [Streptomyces sp. NPDC005485]|uniref:polysaccharide biosynthesis tyrosine autokinase n=1 Tax=Streptomyces sp. NPDC005485 TaxID=3155591 RepID=UPI0033AE24CB
MDLHDYIDVLRRRWRIIAGCILLGAVAALAVTALMPRTYTAKAQLFVATSDGNSASAYEGSLFTQQRVKSYTRIATSPAVLGRVIDKLNLNETPDQLAGKISARVPLDTTLVDIQVQGSSAARAQAIADEAAAQLSTYIEEIEKTSPTSPALVKADVVGGSEQPTSPTSPRPELNLAIGLFLGTVLGIGCAALRNSLDTSLRSAEDIDTHLGLATMGAIPDANHRGRRDAGPGAGTTQRTEAFSQLRIHLRFAAGGRMPKSVLVAGALPGEGRSETAIGLATSVAHTGRRVVLVEADLRRPRPARDRGPGATAGLTDVLAGRIALGDALQTWGDDRIRMLPSGPLTPDPGALLASQDMGKVLRALEAEADLVIVDSPPILSFADAAVLAAETEGVLLVVRPGKTSRDQARRALARLKGVDAHVLGAVLVGTTSGGFTDWHPPREAAEQQEPVASEPRPLAAHALGRDPARQE